MKSILQLIILIAIIFSGGNSHAQNYWQHVATGPGVYSLLSTPAGDIFAGTLASGIYRSTDNGIHWTAVNSGLTNLKIYSLARSPNGFIFAGTDGDGVFGSDNNGSSWVSRGLPTVLVYSLAVNADGYIFAGETFGDVYRSTDYGTS